MLFTHIYGDNPKVRHFLVKFPSQLEKNDRLLKHSLIIMAGSMVVGALNYVYQLMMGRLLGPAEFSVLGALFALIYVVAFSFGAIQLAVSKFTADFSSKGDAGQDSWIVIIE